MCVMASFGEEVSQNFYFGKLLKCERWTGSSFVLVEALKAWFCDERNHKMHEWTGTRTPERDAKGDQVGI